MTHTINIADFYCQFVAEYQRLAVVPFELKDEYIDAVSAFDEAYGTNENFTNLVTKFHEYREYKEGSFEMITSDREAGAFMFALKKITEEGE